MSDKLSLPAGAVVQHMAIENVGDGPGPGLYVSISFPSAAVTMGEIEYLMKRFPPVSESGIGDALPVSDSGTGDVELPEGAGLAEEMDKTVEEKPKRGRPRKTAEKPAEEAPKRGRGRPRKTAEKPAEEAPSISNADLAKAMSTTAAKIGPEEAKGALAAFANAEGQPCSKVNEVQAEDREVFLETLRIMREDS